MPISIDTAAKRAKLPPRKNPYWLGVSGGRGGVSLGYRKVASGPGRWIAKVVIDRARIEERIGDADDARATSSAISYGRAVTAALEWGRQQFAAIEGRQGAAAAAKIPTVRLAVENYVAARKQRSVQSGADAEGRLTRYVLADKKLSDTRLARLRSGAIEDWRAQLPETLSPASQNRLLNDFRAALNSAAEKYRRELPVYLPGEIKAGTKAASITTEARRQLLTDAQVRAVVEAAFAVDTEGDFGHLVLLAAATGARFSQLAALRVCDVQADGNRVMMPSSQKGRKLKPRTYTAVPVSPDVIARLGTALAGRAEHEPLLLRWGYKNAGHLRWERDKRRAWGHAYEVEKLWAATIERANAPVDAIMYALRHSSIVRGLRLGLPVRLVAVLHDTSIEMIEAHYSAFIVDMTEELARRTALAFDAPPQAVLQAAE